ncbi:hypothetical protein [Alcaligenes sp. SDU_A2]|uniref:hypothetical protein n=1 Tax=Alcaligenes sp. SDU_A2 TaxID=3136634 RepID=UPI00311E8726
MDIQYNYFPCPAILMRSMQPFAVQAARLKRLQELEKHRDMTSNQNTKPPADLSFLMRAAAERLEESCAVIDAAEAAWMSPALPDDAKLRIMLSLRRTLIDVILGIESGTQSG